MFLILQVTSANAAMLGAASRAVFTAAGGSIGRRPGNDWVLPDPHVSGRHARVRAIGGTFFLEDNESANGVTVNGNRLHPGEPFPLKDGDTVYIDPFEMVVGVSMTKPGEAAPLPEAPAPAAGGYPPGYPSPQQVPPAFIPPAAAGGGGLLDDIGVEPSGLGDLIPEAGAIPTNWDEGVGTATSGMPPLRPQPAPPPAVMPPIAPQAAPPVPPPMAPRMPAAPAASPAPAGRLGDDFANLLHGAGVQGEGLSPEVMAEFGQVLRSVIEGLMEVLRARGEIRSEFRLPQTSFKPRDNNPLKLAVNAEDAIHNLLVKRNPAYLGTTAAFDDAFKDVRHHQLAMLAGMRAAYGFMLQRFDPQALKAQFDAKPGRKGFGFGTQGRYWEAFEDYYREMTADSDDCFRRLFGDQFARAYEEQIQLLRSARDRTKNET
jgi:type VI secretion system FHA domain protein